MIEPEYLTIPEAAEALRISLSTYYRLVSAGTLRPVNVSPRRVLVPRWQVDAILKLVQH